MPKWGIDTVGVNSSTPNWCRAMGGTSPDLDDMVIKSVSIYVGSTHTQQIRLAIYSGGALDTGPSGATLLYDYGVTSGSATNTWLTITGPDITLPKNSVIWIAYRNNGGYITLDASSSPTGSDFQTGRGRWDSDDLDGDETSAYPSTWPADLTGSFASFWYSVYLTYQVQPNYGGIRFSATGSQYLESVSSFTPLPNVTVCFWMYMDSQTGIQRIIGCDNFYEIGFWDAGGSGNVIFNDLYQNPSANLISNSSISALTWYHIACTRNTSDDATIYINGNLDASGIDNSSVPSSNNLRIAHRTGATDQYFDGFLEDVRIYNRVLLESEIKTIYGAKGIDGITYGLEHRWVMNEGPIDTVASGVGFIRDRGPEVLNMTPNNSPVFGGTRLKLRRFV